MEATAQDMISSECSNREANNEKLYFYGNSVNSERNNGPEKANPTPICLS